MEKKGGFAIMPFVKINGATIHYRMKGSGVPIVFIHPPLITGSVFTRQLAQLSSRYQVIVPDLRGHGQSDDGDRQITYRLIADDMAALLDELEIKKAYLCGYSSGGTIALESLLSYPERWYGGILIGGMSEVNTFTIKSQIWAAARLTGRLRAKRLMAAVIAFGNADRMTTFKRLYSTAVQGNIERMHEYFSCSLTYKCTDRLQEIKQPVLLLYGKDDKRFFSYAKQLRQGLPNNTLHFLKKVSHQIPTKASEQMNELIREWIDRQDPWKTTPRPSKDTLDYFLGPAETAENQPQV